jgi:cyclopropane fatty-acyl-phospholipid synthase-like methyltransferase
MGTGMVMQQRTASLKAVLNFPRVYTFFMNMFSSRQGKSFVKKFIDLPPGSTVLDIGCGPASILEGLETDISYTGVDSNPKYISLATGRFGDRAKFFHMDVDDLASHFTEKFDAILILGTLHHLSPVQVRNLMQISHGLLAKNGVLITHDPIRSSNQNRISKILMDFDRGKHIRYQEEHLEFFKPFFSYTSKIRDDVMRFPYEIIYVKARPHAEIEIV